MERADLIVRLARTGAGQEPEEFKKALADLVAHERQAKHFNLADRLELSLTSFNGTSRRRALTALPGESFNSDTVQEFMPQKRLADLILAPPILTTCTALIREQKSVDLLARHGVDPRNRVLLVGPPGNGKTSLAEALAAELGLPLICLRYDRLIGRYLGETMSRLAKVFRRAHDVPCVLFLDEFDAISKERSHDDEVGEMKRVVNTLLLELDGLPPSVVVIGASNHADMLDAALWRRFQVRVQLAPPTTDDIIRYICEYSKRRELDFGLDLWPVAERLTGVSFAEIEDFCATVKRAAVLAGHPTEGASVRDDCLHEWAARRQVLGAYGKHAEEGGVR